MSIVAVSIEKLKKRLAKKDAPTQRIINELDSLGVPPEEIIDIIEELTAEGYLNDKRYVEEAFYSNQRKGKSMNLLKLTLEHEGISPSILDEVCQELGSAESDFSNAVSLATSYLSKELDKAEMSESWNLDKAINRIMGKLIRRGYDEETAVAAIRDAGENLKNN